MKKKELYVIATLLPGMLMLCLYAFVGIYPFGEKSIIISDLSNQYIDCMLYYREMLLGHEDWLYSWNLGGGNGLSLFLGFYLSSIFNIVLIFFKPENIQNAISLIILLKTCAIGFAAAYFFHAIYQKADIAIVLFSTSYAMMTYVIVYQCHLFWLDGLVFLPILLKFLLDIARKGKSLRFILVLSLACISNFYTAFMICLSTPIFLLHFQVALTKDFSVKQYLKRLWAIIWHGVLGAMLAASFLIPVFFDLSGGAKTLSVSWGAQYNLLELFRAMFIGGYETIRPGGVPFLYAGIPVFGLAVCYFYNNSVSKGNKYVTAGILGAFFLSFMIQPLYLIWHGFDVPDWFEGRFSFVFCFFMIYIAFLSIVQEDKKKKEKTASKIMFLFPKVNLKNAAGVVIFICSVLCLVKVNDKTNIIIAATLVFCCLYAIILYSYQNEKQQKYISQAILVILCLMRVCVIRYFKQRQVILIILNIKITLNPIRK